MLGNWKRPLGLALGLGMAAITWAATPPPQPGALNYVEGQASIDSQAVTPKSVGSTTLNTGDVLSTGNGRAEILLTPGVFMRLGKNSAVRMDSPELTNTRVEVLQGEAMVEADILHNEDHVMIAERGATTELDKTGVYDFDADHSLVQVFDGKATVNEGDKRVDLGKGREAQLDAPNAPLKAQKFDRDSAKAADPLYNWSKLRSEYLADATAATAGTYIVDAGGLYGPGWYGPGWYWNPWWGMYSFVPGDGFFYNPFGFGLYSPIYIYRTPGVHRSGGSVGRPGAVAPNVRPAPAMRAAPSMGGARMGGGFGGGFHGGSRR
jgi:hypothetical protein